MIAGATIPITIVGTLRLPLTEALDGGRTPTSRGARPSPRCSTGGEHAAPGCIAASGRASGGGGPFVAPPLPTRSRKPRFSGGWTTWPTWSPPRSGNWPPAAGPQLLVPRVPPLPSPHQQGGGPVDRP
uniref:Uncharacterized protein n=1 Tax=Oryza sativa subsp. japonica TaxID=39947 RepID=Q6Z168_ORYSJ|nr:hypothetical protein [Oryza sativa Japonica Group]